MKIKTGIGIDVHRLEPGLDFWLGGIKLEHEKGCVAHSDGDVLHFWELPGWMILGYISRIRTPLTRVLIVKFY